MKKLRYYPELNKVTGGITSTILMLQLEYWFEKTDGNTFFKFLEPCEDAQYRKGDSWCEETGFSKGEFRTAFGRIGKAYKSKKEFNESQDKFEGKMYLSYFDRIKRLTFYMRNTKLIEELLNLEGDTNPISTNQEEAPPVSLDYTIQSIQDKKSSAPYEEIVKVYHETCKELPRVESLTQRIKQRISRIWKKVNGDMQRIREVFAKMHASDFLSGRIVGKTWRADLAWVMQVDKFGDVLRDKYAVNYGYTMAPDKDQGKRGEGDSPAINHGRGKGKKNLNRFTNILSHNWDFNQLEAMEQQYIEEKAKSYQGLESALLYKLRDSHSEII